MSVDYFIGHLIGDYLLQNDWMALNKKVRTGPCAFHCALWTLSVWVLTLWPAWTIPVMFVTHFVQDRTNVVKWMMYHKGQFQFAQPPLAPWSIIVVDNVLHLVVLYCISKLV